MFMNGVCYLLYQTTSADKNASLSYDMASDHCHVKQGDVAKAMPDSFDRLVTHLRLWYYQSRHGSIWLYSQPDYNCSYVHVYTDQALDENTHYQLVDTAECTQAVELYFGAVLCQSQPIGEII